MTHTEILTKAISKAIEGGWQPGWIDRRPIVSWGADYSTDYDEGEGVVIWGYHAKSEPSSWFWPLKVLIFDHEFAKTLWGNIEPHPLAFTPVWQYHLQRMVVSDDPIAYLGEHI